MASRIAISFARSEVRARRRLVTFAHDQKDKSDYPHQDQKRLLILSSQSRKPLGPGTKSDPEFGRLARGRFGCDRTIQNVKRCLRLGSAHARFQPPESTHWKGRIGGHSRRPKRNADIQSRILGQAEELLRRDADNGERMCVHLDAAPDHIRVLAESPLP